MCLLEFGYASRRDLRGQQLGNIFDIAALTQEFGPQGISNSNADMPRVCAVSCVSCGRLFTRGSQTGDISSGIGFAWNILRVWQAIQRAQVFAFFRRALSVEMPVPAYICRYSLESSTNATRARNVGVQEDLFQIAPIS
jgi:hypothetical protein